MATTISTDTPLLTADVASRAEVYGGRGLVFDGASDKLILSTSLLDNPNVGAISVWVNTTAISSSNHAQYYWRNQTIISRGNIWFGITLDHNKAVKIGVYTGSATNIITTPNDSISVGNWNHIVYTWNADVNKIYINGENQTLSYTLNATTTLADIKDGGVGEACAIGGHPTNNGFFNGSMSDFKIFLTSSILTDSQVQELYLKPEQSASSAIQSNLKAWYPMCEGNPESPQSIVYDHSEKKLGSELIGDPSFDDANYYIRFLGTGTVDINTTNTGKLTAINAQNKQLIRYNITENGKLYKVTITLDSYTDGSIGGVNNSTGLTFGTLGVGTFTGYFVASGTTFNLRVSGYADFTATDISLKEVLMGNHATTNFFGDELVTNNGFESDGTGWTNIGSPTTSIINTNSTYVRTGSKSWKIIADGDDDGIYQTVSQTEDKTYYVEAYVYIVSGAVELFSNGASIATSSTTGSFQKLSGTYTFGSNTTLTVRSFNASGTFYIDDVSLKEVGVSLTGFDTAVNEPVVPQVPLMKYNQKMIFDNSDDYIDLPSPILNTTHSISFWVHTSNSSGLLMPFSEEDTHEDGVHIYLYSGGISYRVNSVIKTESYTYVNKLIHFCCTYDGSTMNIYANGAVLGSGTSNSTTLSVTTAGNIGARGYSPNYFFDGIIDDFSVFNTALTQSQVQELFNDGVALDATTHSKADDHLLGYWRNDGVTTWTDRSDIQAIGFDGVNDNINLTSVGYALDNYASGAYSIWFYAHDQNPSTAQYVVGGRDGGTNTRVYIQLTSSGLKMAHGNTFGSAVSYSANQWNHIFVSWSSGTVTSYLNGSQSDQFSFSASGGNDSYFFRLGSHHEASGNYFKGNLGQFALWNTAQDSNVSAIYALGRKGSLSAYSSGLQINYLLNPTHSNPDLTGTDKILDRSGNDNHGTQVGGVSFLGANDGDVQGTPDSITIREGLNSNRDGLGFYFKDNISGALRLDSIENVTIPNTKTLSFPSREMSLEAWIKVYDISVTGNIICKDNQSGSVREYSMLAHTANDNIKVSLYTDASNHTAYYSPNNSILEDTWYHIVFTLSGTTGIIYINGDAVTTTTTGNNFTGFNTTESNLASNVQIGKNIAGSSNSFNGIIDEVRIYNKKLSPAEVSKNHKHDKGKHKND